MADETDDAQKFGDCQAAGRGIFVHAGFGPIEDVKVDVEVDALRKLRQRLAKSLLNAIPSNGFGGQPCDFGFQESCSLLQIEIAGTNEHDIFLG